MALAVGTRLGPYEILGAIGAGGMGEVHRARDPRLGRTVAVKVLPADVSSDPVRRRRFEHEARTTGLLNHPNILAVYDVGDHEGAPYLVAELLEGETLRERLKAGTIPVRKAVDWALQAARGLAAAHDKGIVHRDLKPENLFLTKDGIVKILDFGLARQALASSGADTHSPTLKRETGPGVVMGTVAYMSPEQARGETVDHRSDLFSLGSVLYEMLSGRRPFHADSSVETLSAILREEPPGFSEERQVPPALDRLVRHCLEKKAQDRFQSARDLVYELERPERLVGDHGPARRGRHRPIKSPLGDRRSGRTAWTGSPCRRLLRRPPDRTDESPHLPPDHLPPRPRHLRPLHAGRQDRRLRGELGRRAGPRDLLRADGLARVEVVGAPARPGGERLLEGRARFLLDPESGERRALTPEGVGNCTVGRERIACVGPSNRLIFYPLDGGEPREVAGIELEPVTNLLRLSEDESALMVSMLGETRTAPIHVERVDLATGRHTLLHELKPADMAGVVLGVGLQTPDGRGYAYGYQQYLHNLYLADGFR